MRAGLPQPAAFGDRRTGTGYVAKRSVQLGQRVQPGTADDGDPLEQVWVDANFKETQLGKMRLDQPVRADSDVYGSDVTYSGRSCSLGLGTGAAFSLLPAQNASGNWIKIVQRVPYGLRWIRSSWPNIPCDWA
jgi:membrane fusion protein (multidrug efflux system)